MKNKRKKNYILSIQEYDEGTLAAVYKTLRQLTSSQLKCFGTWRLKLNCYSIFQGNFSSVVASFRCVTFCHQLCSTHSREKKWKNWIRKPVATYTIKKKRALNSNLFFFFKTVESNWKKIKNLFFLLFVYFTWYFLFIYFQLKFRVIDCRKCSFFYGWYVEWKFVWIWALSIFIFFCPAVKMWHE